MKGFRETQDENIKSHVIVTLPMQSNRTICGVAFSFGLFAFGQSTVLRDAAHTVGTVCFPEGSSNPEWKV